MHISRFLCAIPGLINFLTIGHHGSQATLPPSPPPAFGLTERVPHWIFFPRSTIASFTSLIFPPFEPAHHEGTLTATSTVHDSSAQFTEWKPDRMMAHTLVCQENNFLAHPDFSGLGEGWEFGHRGEAYLSDLHLADLPRPLQLFARRGGVAFCVQTSRSEPRAQQFLPCI